MTYIPWPINFALFPQHYLMDLLMILGQLNSLNDLILFIAELKIQRIFTFLGEYQINFIECVENISYFTSA